MSAQILILGATSDIARAIAHIHARAGDKLVLAGRNLTELEKDAEDLRIRYQAQASAQVFDAIDYDSHAGFYQNLDPQPDRVYCVFGLLLDQEKAQQNWEEAHRMMEVNYLGAISILEQAARSMEAAGAGTIVGISSVAGDRGRASNYFYGSAKAGFTAYLSGLRNRLAQKGVHVLTVKPGFVQTRMTEGMALPPVITGQPAAVAKAIVKAADKKKNLLYTLWMWRFIMLIIRLIPERIFKKLSL
jgi:decaprenylphospho-beta-D-erythro-pentofuranosid-2-ulose 2-reductase